MTTINQKEYLKKYLAIGKAPGEKKKKKKKEKAVGNRLKIIDDDVDVLLSQEIEEDLTAANEYAPQVVAVIDERPIAIQIDENTKTSLWKPLGEPSVKQNNPTLKLSSFKLDKQISSSDKTNIKIGYSKHITSKSTSIKIKRENHRERSKSPFRRKEDHKLILSSSSSPRISDTGHNSPCKQNDYSPPRRKHKDSLNRKHVESSSSKTKSLRENTGKDVSPPRRGHTPPRLNKEKSSFLRNDRSATNLSLIKEYKDYSPPKGKYEEDSDISPPRKNGSPPFQKNDYRDISPPRRKIKPDNEDNSPPRRKKRVDDSPKVRANDDSSSRRKYKEYISTASSIECNKNYEKVKIKSEHQDLSPSRKHRKYGEERKSRWNAEDTPDMDKMKKTLDGKQAGLQNAKDVVKETIHLRQKEDEIFKNMSEKVSGRNAATVIRDRKVKDLEEETAKEKREQEMKEKYDRWGKGLKQVEDRDKKIEDQLHEMSKPFARYADDEDLETFLKNQEREGDPMLEYIRKKTKKQKVAAGIPEKPMYMGEFMPNRFGIRPGYRWDGVDRSNGYEKKYFQVQNAKKANQEEAFMWSTEDM